MLTPERRTPIILAMDHQGERRNPIIELSKEVIQTLLESYLPGQKISSVEYASGGYSNTNYKISLHQGPLNNLRLRVFTNGVEAAIKEINLMKWMQGKIPGPQVFYFNPEQTISSHCYAFLEWKNGRPFNQMVKTLSPSDFFDIGHELAKIMMKISVFQFPSMGFLGSDLQLTASFPNNWEFFFPAIEDWLLRGRAGERLGRERTQKLIQLIRDHQPLIESLDQTPTLVHGDFNGKNILLNWEDDKWSVDALLDWEFAFAGHFLSDVGNLLRYDSDLPKEFEQGILVGFEGMKGMKKQGRNLPDQWKQISKLLDLINLCDFLNSPQEKPILWKDSIRLIDQTLNQVGSHLQNPQY